MFFKVILLEQPTRISFWAFTLILTFSHQGRRNYLFFYLFFSLAPWWERVRVRGIPVFIVIWCG